LGNILRLSKTHFASVKSLSVEVETDNEEVEGNYEMFKLIAFSLPCRLYIAPVIGSGDIEYQAYPGVHHS
jgi:hypothetical protein